MFIMGLLVSIHVYNGTVSIDTCVYNETVSIDIHLHIVLFCTVLCNIILVFLYNT